MSDIDDLKFAQGPARLATIAEIARENTIAHKTKPDLHRRIDDDLSITELKEAYLATEAGIDLTTENDYILLAEVSTGTSYKANYTLSVQGTNSFRTTKAIIHDEESTDSEIP